MTKTNRKSNLPDCWEQPVRLLLIGIIAVCIIVIALPFIPHMAEHSYLYSVLVAVAAVIVGFKIVILALILTLPKKSLSLAFEVLKETSPLNILVSPSIPYTPPRNCAPV